jgi:hypothetical protein
MDTFSAVIDMDDDDDDLWDREPEGPAKVERLSMGHEDHHEDHEREEQEREAA